MSNVQAYYASLKKSSSIDLVLDDWIIDKLNTDNLDTEGRGILVITKDEILNLINLLGTEPMIQEDKDVIQKKLNRLLKECQKEGVSRYICF